MEDGLNGHLGPLVLLLVVVVEPKQEAASVIIQLLSMEAAIAQKTTAHLRLVEKKTVQVSNGTCFV